MTTVADLVEDVRDLVYGSHRAQLNKLSAQATTSATTMTMTYELNGLTRSSYIALGDELVYVWATTPSSKEVTVERAQRGTTAVQHAANTIVEVDPRFPRHAIVQALRDEIRSWHPKLYAVDALTITVTDPDVRGYDLPATDLLHVIEARIEPYTLVGDTSSKSWPELTFEVERNMPTAVFASGIAIKFPKLSYARVWGTESSRDIRVRYAKKFDTDPFTVDTVLETDVGLETEMLDLARYGAAWRLMATREVKRTFTESQGEYRKSEEVPPGHISSTARELKRLRDERLAEVAAVLMHRDGLVGF